ncbi:hypothetical protein GUJ93_ZPchr0002g26752 [Zizania palustris]|uniref:Uncharacterized protein n=1 Tax=Zizania palustris TaxID=103762 RepID=A0A8J5RZH8_ZIZPA|nr:hypothetical protein GUJ93_ZPchr0002g26752 [Zizania palustris]
MHAWQVEHLAGANCRRRRSRARQPSSAGSRRRPERAGVPAIRGRGPRGNASGSGVTSARGTAVEAQPQQVAPRDSAHSFRAARAPLDPAPAFCKRRRFHSRPPLLRWFCESRRRRRRRALLEANPTQQRF